MLNNFDILQELFQHFFAFLFLHFDPASSYKYSDNNDGDKTGYLILLHSLYKTLTRNNCNWKDSLTFFFILEIFFLGSTAFALIGTGD